MSFFEDVIHSQSMLDVKDLLKTMQDLILPGMNGWQMELIDLYECTNLNKLQTSFIYRLQQVIENNKSNSAIWRKEQYINVLTFELLKACKLSDRREFALEPSRLYLHIKNCRFAALADWQCSHGHRLVWVLHESKNIKTSTYKSSDMQLVACRLAAYQWNYNVLEVYYPDTILGMKVKGDKLISHHFCFSLPPHLLLCFWFTMQSLEILWGILMRAGLKFFGERCQIRHLMLSKI